MPLTDPLDTASANGFIVTIDGVQVPKVNSVSGLKMEVEKIEHKQQTADGKYVVRQLMGRPKAGEFTVTRGLTDSKTITDWMKFVTQGDVKQSRKTASVQITDHMGKALKTYNFTNCWVSTVEISELKAGAAEEATEKFTVNYDEMTVV